MLSSTTSSFQFRFSIFSKKGKKLLNPTCKCLDALYISVVSVDTFKNVTLNRDIHFLYSPAQFPLLLATVSCEKIRLVFTSSIQQ